MRGSDTVRGSLFSYVDLEQRIRADHPLRVIRGIVNTTLTALSGAFDGLYSPLGRESIPPERLLRALLLQAFYSIRSERQLVERIEFDLLFRWFVGLGVDDPVWDATTFTKNRDRLLDGDVAVKFLAGVLAQPQVKALLSSEHFSVDGTLLEAWASTKSFRPKDGSGPPPDAGRNGEQDFHGQKRSNETHASTTDPDARLYRKGRGKEAKLCFMGHALMENRNGLIVGAVTTRASGHAERLAAVALVKPHADRAQPVTLGGDKGFDAQDFIAELREINVTPHVAQNLIGRRSAIPGSKSPGTGRTKRQPGYEVRLSHPQTDRGGLRLGKNRRRDGQAAPPRAAQGRLAIHPRHGRLQPGTTAKAAGSGDMTAGVRPQRHVGTKNAQMDDAIARKNRQHGAPQPPNSQSAAAISAAC